MTTYFITGIDTDIGKTYATAFLLKHFGGNIISQKLVQTGNQDISEDIITHRTLTNTPLTRFDKDGTTCPYVFAVPASPHLASRLENAVIDPNVITQATQKLQHHYQTVLLEGAGGAFVPLTETLLTLDYVANQGYPVILVTCGRLGSINHTLLSLHAIKSANLPLYGVVFNHYFDDDSLTLSGETQRWLKNYLGKHFPDALWFDMPSF